MPDLNTQALPNTLATTSSRSDALNDTFSRDAGENVDNFTIYGTPTGYLINENYVVTVNNGVFTINPRSLEITEPKQG